jgi:ribonuclease Z
MDLAITLTPVVGTPTRQNAENFIPGTGPLRDGELRVTVLGSGNPWITRAFHPPKCSLR